MGKMGRNKGEVGWESIVGDKGAFGGCLRVFNGAVKSGNF